MHLDRADGISQKKVRILIENNVLSLEELARCNYSYIDNIPGLSGDLIGRAQQALPEWDSRRKLVESNRQESSWCEYCEKEHSAMTFKTASSVRSSHEAGCGRDSRNGRSLKEAQRQL